MTDQTPATEAGRRDRKMEERLAGLRRWAYDPAISDDEWAAVDRPTYRAIETEARAAEHQVTDDGDGAPWVYMSVADLEADRQEARQEARADALREAADAVETEIAVIYDRTRTAETMEAAKALHEVLDRLRALHAILDPQP